MSSRVLVYGGKGALGSTLVDFFKSKNWWVLSVDINPNEDAHSNVIVEVTDSWINQSCQVFESVDKVLDGNKLDAVLCVAGGWAGGNSSSNDFVKNCDMMWKQSVWSSSIAAQLASKNLKDGGILTLTGASPCLKGTPGMIGYGMAKAAVHQLVSSLAQKSGGLPNNSFVSAILPVTLDTPMNRKFMPNADTSSWTPLSEIAGLFYGWSQGLNRPSNGSLVEVITKDEKTEFNTI